jgi:hypothetical protein
MGTEPGWRAMQSLWASDLGGRASPVSGNSVGLEEDLPSMMASTAPPGQNSIMICRRHEAESQGSDPATGVGGLLPSLPLLPGLSCLPASLTGLSPDTTQALTLGELLCASFFRKRTTQVPGRAKASRGPLQPGPQPPCLSSLTNSNPLPTTLCVTFYRQEPQWVPTLPTYEAAMTPGPCAQLSPPPAKACPC